MSSDVKIELWQYDDIASYKKCKSNNQRRFEPSTATEVGLYLVASLVNSMLSKVEVLCVMLDSARLINKTPTVVHSCALRTATELQSTAFASPMCLSRQYLQSTRYNRQLVMIQVYVL